MPRSVAAILLIAATAAADTTPGDGVGTLVALVYVQDGDRLTSHAVGVSPAGRVAFRRELGDAWSITWAADGARLVLTDDALDAIVCLDRRTGRELWRQKRDAPKDKWVGLELCGRRVFASCYGGDTRALDLATGRLDRTWTSGGTLTVLAGGRTLLLTDHERRRCQGLDAASLDTLWTRDFEHPQESVQAAGPHLIHRAERVSLRDPRTFRVAREVPVDPGPNGWVQARAIAGGTLVSTPRGRVCLAGDGIVRWKDETASDHWLAGEADQRLVFVRYRTPCEVRVVDARTGAEAWTATIETQGWSVSRPGRGHGRTIAACAADRAVWLAHRGTLEVRDAATGRTVATVSPDGSVRDLRFHRGRVVVLTERSVQGFDAATGRALWSTPLNVAAAGGMIVDR